MKPTQTELEKAIQTLDGADELTYRQIDALGTILTALEAAQKDSERLDWLQRTKGGLWNVDYGIDCWPDGDEITLRAAIDAAISAHSDLTSPKDSI